MKKNGFIISTTIYGIFGIMLLTVFYILFIISNNRHLVSTNINDIKSELEKANYYTSDTGNIENPDESFDIEEPISSPTIYHDTSGANYPKLADGMIPVVYSAGVWKKADLTTKWYDYNTQMWANAVTVTSTNREKYLADDYTGEIPMDDINSMWVWIPRFKYKIPQNMGSSNRITNPPQIHVIFEKNLNITGVSETVYRNGITGSGKNTNYYTHPAFRDIDNMEYSSKTKSWSAWYSEITGFWVGKFETGGNYSVPLIKPDIISLGGTNITINDQFQTSIIFANGTFNTTTKYVTFNINSSSTYGLNTISKKVDTHMMKNTEWGAVAILSQSQYGKNGNSSYSGTNKEIYKNNSSSYYTGRSAGSPSGTNTTSGTYSYYNGTNGQGASTTGTIYGIYDMNGGRSENVMGVFMRYQDLSGISFSTATYEKYTDYYYFAEDHYYDNAEIKSVAILGDATWETRRWYTDDDDNIDYYDPWSIRGTNGIFAYSNSSGRQNEAGFRTVLMP